MLNRYTVCGNLFIANKLSVWLVSPQYHVLTFQWLYRQQVKEPCYSRIKFDCYNLTDSELKIKVEVDDLKPEEQNKQTGMLATEHGEKVIKIFY